MLNIECDKCDRRGQYHLHRLIERYGVDTKLFDWSDEVTADCPRKQAKNLNDMCAAVPGFVKGGLSFGIANAAHILRTTRSHSASGEGSSGLKFDQLTERSDRVPDRRREFAHHKLALNESSPAKPGTLSF